MTPLRLVRFGLYEVDLQVCELRKRGRKIRLQEQPYQILRILLERQGEVVSREEIRQRLWPSDTFVDFDHSLNTAMTRLREVLGDSSENPIFIETLPRKGYRFIAPVIDGPTSDPEGQSTGQPVAEVREDRQASINPSPNVLQLQPEVPQTRLFRFPWIYAAALGGIVIALVVLAVGLTYRYSTRRVLEPAKPNQVRSLAVLPLENLSRDQDQDYFADGMTGELIARFAQLRTLRVISRATAMQYKGAHKPLSEIAKELNVDAVVGGTVLRSGDKVRITVELVQVSTDRDLWAETYERPAGDILSLQRDVASAVVSQIRVELTPEEQKQLVSSQPINTEAYEDYLKGRFYCSQRSEKELDKAVEYFRAAIEKDPHYALAYAGLADCYGTLGAAILATVPPQEVAPKAKAAAIKALEIDSASAEAETSLATVEFNYDWDWAAADKGFQRAIQLNPNYASAHQRYSLYLTSVGRTQESIAEISRARSLDPLSLSVNFSLGWRLYMARQYEEAIQQLKNTIDMDPTFALSHLVLGQCYEQEGKYELAATELQKAAAISHDSAPMIAALGHLYAVSGRKPDAWKMLGRLENESKHQYVSPFYIATVYAGLGESDRAMVWLEKAYSDRSNHMVFLHVDPELDSLRSDPKFGNLMRRMSL